MCKCKEKITSKVGAEIVKLKNEGLNVNLIASMLWIQKEHVECYLENLNAPKKDTKPTVEPVVEPDANV
jgi:hypothetical protein